MEKFGRFLSEPTHLCLIVPITQLSKNYMNLEMWLRALPEGDLEVILVHDIQDSDTGIVMDRLLSKAIDRRIKFFEGTFGAPGLARNFGVSVSNSQWTWFVDADDLPNIPNVLKELNLTAATYDVIIGQYEIDIGGRRTQAKKAISPEGLTEIARNPGIWRMIFRTEIINSHEFREFRMAEDQLFIIDVGLFTKQIKFSSEIFYTYYKHSFGQLTSQVGAISDLAQTIPLVAKKVALDWQITQGYLEVILARQIGTFLKNSNSRLTLSNVSRIRNWIENLKKRSQLRVYIELIKILLFKVSGSNNG